jgi:hypothetical protein
MAHPAKRLAAHTNRSFKPARAATAAAPNKETNMIGYVLGCLTVGALWRFWPKLSAWFSGEKTALDTAAKADLTAVANNAKVGLSAVTQDAKADLSAVAQGAKAEADKLAGKL